MTKANPGLDVLTNAFDGFLTWVWVGALIGIGWAVWARDRLTIWLLSAAAGWLTIVAVLTQAGKSSGVTRFLVITQAILCVVCGIGWVQVVRSVQRRLPSAAGRLGIPSLVALLAIPSAITGFRWAKEGTSDVRYQEGAYEATAHVIAAGGGLLRPCGQFAWSAPYREPELAFRLHKHLYFVRSEFGPDLPDSSRLGPMVQISLKDSTRQAPVPFKDIRYATSVQSRFDRVIATLRIPG